MSGNWWNIKKTAYSSTERYVLGPTKNKKNEKERLLARSKEQSRKDKEKKDSGLEESPWLWKGLQHCQTPPEREPSIHTVSGIFPRQNVIQNKGQKNKSSPLSHPADPSKKALHVFGQLTDFNIVMKSYKFVLHVAVNPPCKGCRAE